MTQLIDLGKLRFYFAGDYVATTQYELNDVVRYGGNVYVYTYTLAATGHAPTDTAYWALLLKGIAFAGTFDATVTYHAGQAVAYGASVYVALGDATGILPTVTASWSLLVQGSRYLGAYSSATVYVPGDLVSYGGAVFQALKNTTAVDPTDATAWIAMLTSIAPAGVYNSATAYAAGQVVAYGARLYRALGNTTGNLPTVATSWALFQDGVRYLGTWTAATAYVPQDVVQRGGNTYVCLVAHASSTAFATDLTATTPKWAIYNGGVRWKGTYAATTAYLNGDLVTDGISSYIATADFTSGAEVASAQTNLTVLALGQSVLPVQTGNAGKALVTNGTAVSWGTVGEKWSVKSAAYTAAAGDCLMVDTSSGSFTITLPATPSVGDKVRFMDPAGQWASRNFTIARNASLIEARSEDLAVDVSAGFDLLYTGSTYGWKAL